MYKLYIKRSSAKNIFEPYAEEKITENVETGKPQVESIEWSTDDLNLLADKYKELLSIYTTKEVRPIEELDTEIMIDITD